MQKNIAIYRSIDTWLEKQYAQLGLTGLQASAIMVLLDAHKISQSELADALGVGKSAVSKVSSKLLELGYAERRRRRKDKRLHLLCPTQKAAQLSPQLFAIQDQLEEILFSDFWEGDRERLEYFLERIRDNISLLHGRSFEPVSPYRMDDIPDDPRKITPEQWEAMRKVDIRTVDKSQLVDIRSIKIDEKLPPIERWFSYLRQVKNPYCVRVGDIAIKLNFPDEH